MPTLVRRAARRAVAPIVPIASAFAALTLAASDARAQAGDSVRPAPAVADSMRRPARGLSRGERIARAWCMRRRPDCRYLFLLETGYFQRLGGSAMTTELSGPFGEPLRPTAIYRHGSLDYGILFHPERRASIGVSAHGAVDAYGARIGPRLRYRRWVDSATSVEIAGGPFWASQDAGPSEGAGVSADVRLNFGDRFAFSGRQNVSWANGRPAAATFAGASLGGRPAALALATAVSAGFLWSLYVVSTW